MTDRRRRGEREEARRISSGPSMTRISSYDPDGALTETGIIGEDWKS